MTDPVLLQRQPSPPPVSRIVAGFLVFLLLTLGLFYFLMAFERKDINTNLRANHEQQIRYIGKTIAKALEIPMWNVDTRAAQEHLETFKKNPSICGAHVVDHGGSLFAEVGLLPRHPGKDQEIYTFNIASPGEGGQSESLGKLLICASTGAISKNIAQSEQREILDFFTTFIGGLAVYIFSLLIILKPSRFIASLGRGIGAFFSSLGSFFLSPFSKLLGRDDAKLKLPWHYVYFILAGFDILTVCISLYINHRLVEMYDRAAAANLEWSARQEEILNLSDLSVDMSAPGNDVFISNDPLSQKKKFDIIFRDFNTAFSELIEQLNDTFYRYRDLDFLQAEKADLTADMEAIKLGGPEILVATNAIFKSFSEGNREEAAGFMARMDQQFALQSERLSKAAQDISRIQNKLSVHQARQAELLHKLEFVIFALAAMMVCFAVVYGKRLSAQMKRDQAELEDHRHNLEKVVAEQTRSLREEAEKNLKLRDEAEAAGKAKSDFFAIMSHELRTPLNSVIGHVQILEQERITAEQRETFSDIRRSAETLLYIVNDILDFSKIGAGEVRLESVGFDAYQKIRHIAQALKPIASRKGLALSCEVDAEKLYVLGDPMRFSRILTNLLSNAIRYTDKGSVEMCAAMNRISPGEVMLRCEVRDTGIGISENTKKRLFQKFSQGDSSTTRRYGGTGLGLAISKELIELMGGRIGVESEEGKGSTFWFEILFETVGHLDAAAFDNADFETRQEDLQGGMPAAEVHVLMAEDHEMNQKFMKKLFKNLGIVHYKIVDNGLDAVREVKSGHYDVVLMDCHMPEMNGYDATMAIRNLDDVNKKSIPIVGITANAMPEDEKRCLEIGMTAYISKPVNLGIFKRKLAPWINFSQPASEESINEEDLGDDLPPVNLDNLLENSMGDMDFVKDMVAMFVSQGAEQIGALKGLCVDGENEEWSETAHALKGTAGSVGAEKMRRLCARAQVMKAASAGERTKILAEIKNCYMAAKDALLKTGYYVE